VLLSGGIDSATCVQLTRGKYHLRALTFAYQGIARREIDAAKEIALATEIDEHRIVRLPDLREAGEIGGANFANVPPTYIPMRNGVFYALAASYAEEVGAELIIGGHIKDDVRTFRDAAPVFFEALGRAFRLGSPVLKMRKTRIVLPLSGKTKVQVVKLASSLGVPLELTWSCHREGRDHCWSCDGCSTRRAAFDTAGVLDPLRDPDQAGKIT
jgi:7-cyano-7-deazaguanine synthase